MAEVEVGKVTHFFDKIMVAVVALTHAVKAGDTLHVKGATSDFVQKLDSMQVDHAPVNEAKAGVSIGLKMQAPVHQGDVVFKVEEA